MKRIYPFTFAVVLALLVSAGGVLAQGWGRRMRSRSQKATIWRRSPRLPTQPLPTSLYKIP